MKDKVQIPNGLQSNVERQARHDADQAGDLQHTDNPYAPGGAKFGFDFSTGRALVGSRAATPSAKMADDDSAGSRGKHGSGNRRPFVQRGGLSYQPNSRFGGHGGYQHDIPTGPSHQYASMSQVQSGRQYPNFRSLKPVMGATAPRIPSAENRTA